MKLPKTTAKDDKVPNERGRQEILGRIVSALSGMTTNELWRLITTMKKEGFI